MPRRSRLSAKERPQIPPPTMMMSISLVPPADYRWASTPCRMTCYSPYWLVFIEKCETPPRRQAPGKHLRAAARPALAVPSSVIRGCVPTISDILPQADMQQYFRVSPPSVHQMVITLERSGFIRRQPGVARSIEMLVDPQCLPVLRDHPGQPVKITVQRY